MRLGIIATAFAAMLVATPALGQTDGLFAASYKFEGEKRFDQAAAQIQPLADQGHEFARLRLGWLNYSAARYSDSIRFYNRVIDANPQTIDGRLGLMLPLMAQKRWEEAAAQARQVLTISPAEYTAQVRLLACQEALKQWPQMEQQARTLAAYYPSDATGLLYLARARAWLGRIPDAKAAYGQVLERFPSNDEARSYIAKNP